MLSLLDGYGGNVSQCQWREPMPAISRYEGKFTLRVEIQGSRGQKARASRISAQRARRSGKARAEVTYPSGSA